MDDLIVSIAQYLESFNSSEYNLRQLRSGILAQLLSNQLPLDYETKVGDVIADHQTAINRLISAVNEYVSIDFDLTKTMLHQILVTRQMLIFGVANVELLRFVMNNKVSDANIDPKLNDILKGIAQDGESVSRLGTLSKKLFPFVNEGDGDE